jgi:hypothetical protein
MASLASFTFFPSWGMQAKDGSELGFSLWLLVDGAHFTFLGRRDDYRDLADLGLLCIGYRSL